MNTGPGRHPCNWVVAEAWTPCAQEKHSGQGNGSPGPSMAPCQAFSQASISDGAARVACRWLSSSWGHRLVHAGGIGEQLRARSAQPGPARYALQSPQEAERELSGICRPSGFLDDDRLRQRELCSGADRVLPHDPGRPDQFVPARDMGIADAGCDLAPHLSRTRPACPSAIESVAPEKSPFYRLSALRRAARAMSAAPGSPRSAAWPYQKAARSGACCTP